MAVVGYARVSSVGQSLEVQLDKLAHCDKLYREKQSATQHKRPQLQACMEYVREGDTDGCCSICWGPLHNLRRKSVPNGKWTASKRQRNRAHVLGEEKVWQCNRSLNFRKDGGRVS